MGPVNNAQRMMIINNAAHAAAAANRARYHPAYMRRPVYLPPMSAATEALLVPAPPQRETVAQHTCELVWDAPSDDDGATMLRAVVDGKVTELAVQRGDDFGLLMELADMPGAGILPPWGEVEDDDAE